MENASKALLIAGGVLIAVLILSIAVHLVVTYKEVGTAYEDMNVENEVKSFNNNFTKFIGRTDITPQEIVSIINYCEEYEQNYGVAPEIDIKNASPYNITKIKKDAIEFIITSTNNKWTFYCDVKNVSYDEQGKINKIVFTKNR